MHSGEAMTKMTWSRVHTIFCVSLILFFWKVFQRKEISQNSAPPLAALEDNFIKILEKSSDQFQGYLLCL